MMTAISTSLDCRYSAIGNAAQCKFVRRFRFCAVVGYVTSDIPTANQQKMVGGTFVSVGAEALDIQDITVTGNPDDGAAWIKWWDPETKKYSAKAVYVYQDSLYDIEGELLTPRQTGWVDSDWVPVEKEFQPSEGLWWGVNKDNCTLCMPNPFYVAPAN